MTFTKQGKTTVYGIAVARGIRRPFDNNERMIYFRVANVDALKWIKGFIEKYEN